MIVGITCPISCSGAERHAHELLSHFSGCLPRDVDGRSSCRPFGGTRHPWNLRRGNFLDPTRRRVPIDRKPYTSFDASTANLPRIQPWLEAKKNDGPGCQASKFQPRRKGVLRFVQPSNDHDAAHQRHSRRTGNPNHRPADRPGKGRHEMSSSSGLTRRRGAAAGGGPSGEDGENGGATKASPSANARDSAPETSYEQGENGHKIAFDPRDMSESAERSKQPKLTLMEEVLLLGLKDKQVIATPAALPVVTGTREAGRTDREPAAPRATSPSGTTTSRTPCAGASSSSWPSAAASACRRMPREGASRWPTA